MNHKILLLLVLILIFFMVIIFIFCIIHSKPEIPQTYDFIGNFSSAKKHNFTGGNELDNNFMPVAIEFDYFKLKDRIDKIIKITGHWLEAGKRKNIFSQDYTDGFLRLSFVYLKGNDHFYNFVFKYRDKANYYGLTLKTGDLFRLKVYRFVNGAEEILQEVIVPGEEENIMTLEILFLDDFLAVGYDKRSIFQGRDPSYKRSGKISFNHLPFGKTGRTMNVDFIAIEGQLKKRILQWIEEPGLEVFQQRFHDARRAQWNTLKGDDRIICGGKPNDFLRRLRLKDEIRHCIYFKMESSLEYNLTIPDNAVLEFYLASPLFWAHDPKRIQFSVDLISDSGAIEKTYNYRLGEFKNISKEFKSFIINLSEYSRDAKRIRFRLNTIDGKTERDEGKVIAALADPMIFAERLEGDTNIIFIVLDTLAADHVGCYGYKRNTSPRIDQFAEEYTLFRYCISQAPYTLPSHMSLFTSLYPEEAGYASYDSTKEEEKSCFAENVILLQQYLKSKHYKNVAITDGGHLNGFYGYDRGFDLYCDKSRAIPDIKPHMDKAIDWIEKNKHHKFFMFFHTYEIHDPYMRDYFVRKELDPKKMSKRDQYIAMYDSGILYADAQIGRLIDYLEKENLLRNTMLIITSDHGENFITPTPLREGVWGHHGTSLLDCELHVPLIIGGVENFRGGLKIDRLVRLIDLMPTVLDYLDMKPKQAIRGSSILPLLTGSHADERLAYSDSVLFGIYPGYSPRSLRSSQYKYIYFKSVPDFKNKRAELDEKVLYDLRNDPQETKNVVNDLPKIVKMYHDRIIKILDSIEKNRDRLIKRYMLKMKDNKELEEQLHRLGYIN